MKLLPIVAYSAFVKDFNLTSKNPIGFYYNQQCAMKFMFGPKSSIKFV